MNPMIKKAIYTLDPARFIKEALSYQVEPCHQSILTHIAAGKKTLDLAPRGFGKSTIGDIGYCLWKVVQDRNVRILIVSNTQSQAEAFLREIKYHLTANDKLQEIYGTFRSDKWTENDLFCSGRTIPAKEGTLTALGASGAVISKHFDIIIADDVVDFENARTELQRKKLSEWYRTSLLPCLEPHGELHVIGTRYHPGDLYQEMIDSEQYSVNVQRAISDGPAGTSLWDSKFSLPFLLYKKAELGSIIFAMQYQNDITLARQGNIFQYQWMQFYDTPPALDTMRIFQGCDLALSMKETADYFCLVTLGITKEKDIYILDVYRSRLSFMNQQEVIKQKANQWHPVSIGIETNAYQKAMAQALISSTLLPIKQITTIKDKVTRAQRRSALFENMKVFVRKDNMTILIDELCLFPDAAHDDTFDALDLALTAADSLDPNRFKVMHRRMGMGTGTVTGTIKVS